MQKKVILITGPTAVGKTAAAIHIARHFQTEIISADSRQCFKELSIGVARPSVEELQQVPHHFVTSHHIDEAVSAAIFEKYAIGISHQIFRSKDVLVMAGGTGLYAKAFMEGLDDIPAIDADIRSRLLHEFELNGIDWLQDQLRQRDPLYSSQGSMHNPQRMLRALEVITGTGQSILSFQQKKIKLRDFDVVSISLELPREELYTRINARVDQMMATGLWEEVQELYPYRHLNALQTVGYKELFDYVDGKHTMQVAVELIKRNTRQFAKRQCTWFAHQLEAQLFHPEAFQSMLTYIESELTSDRT
jgi:tRNA dimethylallyltransferase